MLRSIAVSLSLAALGWTSLARAETKSDTPVGAASRKPTLTVAAPEDGRPKSHAPVDETIGLVVVYPLAAVFMVGGGLAIGGALSAWPEGERDGDAFQLALGAGITSLVCGVALTGVGIELTNDVVGDAAHARVSAAILPIPGGAAVGIRGAF
jgi:hypothetical protein